MGRVTIPTLQYIYIRYIYTTPGCVAVRWAVRSLRAYYPHIRLVFGFVVYTYCKSWFSLSQSVDGTRSNWPSNKQEIIIILCLCFRSRSFRSFIYETADEFIRVKVLVVFYEHTWAYLVIKEIIESFLFAKDIQNILIVSLSSYIEVTIQPVSTPGDHFAW